MNELLQSTNVYLGLLYGFDGEQKHWVEADYFGYFRIEIPKTSTHWGTVIEGHRIYAVNKQHIIFPAAAFSVSSLIRNVGVFAGPDKEHPLQIQIPMSPPVALSAGDAVRIAPGDLVVVGPGQPSKLKMLAGGAGRSRNGARRF